MILNSPTISGSLTVTGNILTSGSITLSGSVASASYALSASNAQTASFANAFTVAGNLTAQTLVVQTITSSVDFVTGSTRFGSLLSNTHVFSGSVSMNPGGLFVSGSGLVGIGTINPASGRKLTVAGGAQFTYTDNGGASFNIVPGINGQDGADFNLSYYTGTGYGPLTFTLGGSERMRITSGGNVGIGTTNIGSEANLHLGAFGANEGGQLILQRGTSYTSASHLDNYQNRFRIMSGNDTGSTAERLSLNMTNGDLTVYGSSNLGTNIITSNSPGATAGQYGNAVSAEYGSSSWAVNLATILPNYSFTSRGLSVQLQILGLSDGSNGSSVLAHAYRSIGGTWVVNTVNTATNGTTFINSITASGTTITINWNTTAFGCVNVNVINRA
jgi:hypothetical protein